MNNFLTIARLFALIPYLIQGIEQAHADAPGATKKQLALESLGLAATSAINLLPGEKSEIAAASQLASVTIDAAVTAANTLGVFKKTTK